MVAFEYIYLFSIAIALGTGLVNYKNLSPSYLRLTLLYLFASLAVEIAGVFTANAKIRNYFLYNLFVPIEFLFFAYLYVRSFSKKESRTFGWAYMFCLFLFAVVDIGFIQGLSIFDTYVFLLGSFFTVLLSSLYLYQNFSSISVRLSTNPLFWISIGLLFFYLTELIHLGIYNYLVREHKLAAATLAKMLQLNNTVMYSFYSIGFICSKKTQK